MRRAKSVKLDQETRDKLTTLQKSRTSSVRLVERVSIVLLADDGLENIDIAERLNISRQKAGRWRDRFIKYGIKGIEKDAPRPRRIPTVSKDLQDEIIRKTIEEKPPNATHWSRSSMAKATGLSDSTIGRIWKKHGL